MAVTIAGNCLCCVTVAKHRYLELYIDQHLTWQQYFDHIVSKAIELTYTSHSASTVVCLLIWFNYKVFIIPLLDSLFG